MALHSTSPPRGLAKSTHAPNAIDFSPILKAEIQPKSKPKAPLRTIFPHLEIEEHAIDDTPPLKAIVVGAGIGGINAGIILPQKVPGLDLKIYEKTSDVGGVWNTNIYPGVKCDIPADVYQSTFAPSTEWSTPYASGAEIKAYWKSLVNKYNVEKFISFNSIVKRATWAEAKGKWIVDVTVNGQDQIDEAEFLITATGHFSNPLLPRYQGIEDYKGHLRHSSNWDPSFDPTGKRVAVIGNGASGLQILPPLQKVVQHLDHYARSPTWIAGSFGGEDLNGLTTTERPPQSRDAATFHEYRKNLEAKSFKRFAAVIKNGEKNAALRSTFKKLMADRLDGRTDLLDTIVPEFSPSCRRLTPGPGYLEALTKDNVSYISTNIEKFTENGIQTTDGVHREVDAVICCTGADISFSSAFPIIANGVDLQKAWRPEGTPGFPDTYLSIAAPNFPNLLFILGPNATGQAGTLPNAVENQMTYIAKILRKVATQGIRSITPTQAATNDFRAYCESFFPRTVMSEECSSWFNGGIAGGRVSGIWPGSGIHANIVKRDVRWEDFTYTYLNGTGNRFSYLGNGFSKKELAIEADPDAEIDFTPYLLEEAVNGTVDLRSYNELWFDI
ncbi:putative sterigmatocystin biosynthesis monooxygenase [Lachnellula hyalina]|uniref:Putative sterigmatocystin biosynthesis monooxygenase n=1 Tax=Lachnellula hyalina TaxID=1316788 RepID=A0A8H8R5K8_9HELO|nr:putative sterigmatocystin biosynthesis monooxygenase [Lachnellula hyalina]TVY28748.1 putative sterigmatocystin biosynthesis monooxygenase [Lachnellula hyalina]